MANQLDRKGLESGIARVFRVVIGAMIWIVAPNFASAVVTPGAVQGSFNTNGSGVATYNVPIVISPGTAAVVPAIALNYSSQGENGLAGQGFDIGSLPAVYRCPRTLTQDAVAGGVNYDADDRFCFLGQRLIAIAGTYGADAAEYHTEVDNYAKVVSYGTAGTGPAWFKVWMKSGLILELGNSADSRVEAQGKSTAAVWALNKVYDRVGNYYTVSYVEDSANGEHYVSRVDYTGNAAAGLLPYASVRFSYESRPDVTTKYQAGALMKTKVRLTKVQTYTSVNNSDTLVREYRLAYLPADATQPSRLQSVTECGFENGTELCLPATVFGWQGGGFGVFSIGSSFISSPSSDPSRYTTVRYADLNADGKADYCYRDYTGILCYPSGQSVYSQYFYGPAWSDANGWGSNGDQGVGSSVDKASYYSTIQFPDLNADGKADVCARTKTGIECWTGTGSSFVAGVNNTNLMSDSGGWNNYKYYATIQYPDIDGDGKADICGRDAAGIICYKGNGVGVFLPAFRGPNWSDAAGWDANWKTGTEPKYFTTIQFPDLNGDGRADVCGRFSDGIRCAINTGSGFGPEFALHAANEALSDGAGWGQPQYYSTISYPDLNGDGNADVCGRGGAGLQCWLNPGNGTPVTSKFSIGPMIPNANPWSDANGWAQRKYYATIQYTDINGDGTTDVCARNSQGIECWIGTGTSFVARFTGPSMADPYYDTPQAYSAIRFIDYSGDGKADVCEPGKCWSGGVPYGSNGAGPALIGTITDGLNKQITVTYKPLTDSSIYTKGSTANSPANVTIVRDVQSPSYVVATTEAKNPLYTNATASRASHAYWFAKAENTGRGFLGFGATEVTDPDTGIVNRTEYRQDFPFIGRVKRSERRIQNTKLFEADHTMSIEFLYGGKIYNPQTDKTVAKNYELDGSLLTTVTTTTQWDWYGNPRKTTVATLAQNPVTGFSETHTRVIDQFYLGDTVNWLVGKLKEAWVTQTLPDGTSQVRKSQFAFSATTPDALLRQEILEPYDASLKRTKDYLAFDLFGNALNVTETGQQINDRQNLSTWDTRGRFMTSATNPLGHKTSFEYDERFGTQTKITDPNNLVTTVTYDALGREKTRKLADGTTFTYTYGTTCSGNCAYSLTTTVRNGATIVSPDTTTSYDFLGRAIRVDVPTFASQASIQVTEYDRRGRVARTSRRVVDSGNWTNYHWTTYTYDVLDRVKTVTGPDGALTTTTYSGFTTKVRSPKNFETIRIVNGVGQVIKLTEPIDASRTTSTTYAYDPFGNLRASTDSAGNTVSSTYDVMGRKITQSDPDLGNWSWNYFPFNFLRDAVMITTPRGTVDQRYDRLGRLTFYKTSDLVADWFYDAAPGAGKGKLSFTQTSAGYKRTYAYDALGRVQKVDSTIDGVVYSTQSGYDSAGRLDTVTYPKGFKVKRTYNTAGFPLEVKNGTTGTVYWKVFSMDAEGNVTGETLGNGRATYRTFNEDTGRVERIQTGNGFDASTQDITYTWDAMGNLLTRADAAAGISEGPFTYDAMNRLTSSPVAGGATKTYAYDDIGNLTSRSDAGTYNYAGARPHAVKSVSGAINRSYSYDASGNLLSDGVRTFTWTQFNTPATITKGADFATFTYGSERQRIKQATQNRTIIYAGGGFEAEIAGGVTTFKNYVSAGNGLVAVVTQDVNSTVTATRYMHRDHLGSVSAVTNESGALLERLSFDPFGKRRNPNGTDDTANALTSAHSRGGYTGHEQLDDLDLVHMNGRVYDPSIARFVSPDPFVQAPYFSQSANRYAYVWNNPLTNIDPSGYWSLASWWKQIRKAHESGDPLKPVIDLNDIAGWMRESEALRTVGGVVACYFGTPIGCAYYYAYIAKIQGADDGQAIYAGMMAGVQGAAFTAVGDMGYGAATWQNAVAHGAVGGVFGGIGNGNWSARGARAGFASAFIGEYYSNYGMAGSMVGGGVGSQLSGGTFWSGARTAAFGYIFNSLQHLWDGIEAHLLIQGYYGEMEGYVVETGTVGGQKVDGRVDIAYVPDLTVWEVKKESVWGWLTGHRQLKRYTTGNDLRRGGSLPSLMEGGSMSLAGERNVYIYYNTGGGLILYEVQTPIQRFLKQLGSALANNPCVPCQNR